MTRHHAFTEELTARDLLWITWLPLVLITVAHYTVPAHLHWVHDVLRRLYYLPLIYASLRGGVKVGCAVALFIIAGYLPHAFSHIAHHDPAAGIEKFLEMVLYLGVACLTGFLSKKEKAQRRRVERVLRERERLMDQLVRAGRLSALGEVVAGIAHEIKNPLHSLLGTAEIIDPLIPRDIPERAMWDNHVEELRRLERTSARFLSLAAPPTTDMTPLNLGEVLTRLEGLVGAECRQRDVRLVLRPGDHPVMVRGNADQLVQVGLNVVINALRAMEGKGDRIVVTVLAHLEGPAATAGITFFNNGPHIPEAELERIFDPFHSSNPAGTGLGLSISSGIARAHGGFLSVENQEEGVCFTLRLPRSTT